MMLFTPKTYTLHPGEGVSKPKGCALFGFMVNYMEFKGGLGLGAWGLGLGAWGLGFRVWGLGFKGHMI